MTSFTATWWESTLTPAAAEIMGGKVLNLSSTANALVLSANQRNLILK